MNEDWRDKVQPKPTKPTEMATGLEGVTATDVAKATKSKTADSRKAGQFIRRTFTFTEGQLAMIARVARERDRSQNQIARWLIDQGIQGHLDGADFEPPKEW